MVLVDRFGTPIVSNRAATTGYQPLRGQLWWQRPRDLPVFTFLTINSMLLDPVIRLGLAMRAAPIASAEFAYKEGDKWKTGVRADDPEVAKFVESQITRIWKHNVQKLLRSQIWGWTAGEVVYRTVDNRIEVDKLLERRPRDVQALELHGQLAGVEFSNLAGNRNAKNGTIRLGTPGKAYWHAFQVECEDYYGTSILFGAYSSFADKWFDGGALDVRRLYMHSEAFSGRRIGYPPGVTNIDGKGEVPNRDIAREMVEQYKSGDVMTYPQVFNEKGNPLWTIEDAKVGGNPEHIFRYITESDIAMLRGMEIPDDVLMSQVTGSWAGKQVPMLAFYSGLNVWANDIVKVLSTQVIEPLVFWNYGEAKEFEITIKPLDLQAMEREQGGQQPGQQPGQPGQPDQQNPGQREEGEVSGEAPGPGQNATPSGNGRPSPSAGFPFNSRQRFSVEEAVGAGQASAASLVKRLRREARAATASRNGSRRLNLESAEESPFEHDFSTLMLMLPRNTANEVLATAVRTVDPEDLHEDGFEREPHITVKYGIHSDDPAQVRHVLRNQGPVAVSIGQTSLFETPDYDVLKLEVQGAELIDVNRRIVDTIPNTETHPEYIPHVTIAYLKPGTGRKYTEVDFLLPEESNVVLNEMTFTDRMGGREAIPLRGPVTFAGRAPAGGVTINGEDFKGGEFVPNTSQEEVDKAAAEQSGSSKVKPKSSKPKSSELSTSKNIKMASAQVVDGKLDISGRKSIPKHLSKLRVPPAWKSVQVNLDPQGAVLATGRDAKGRKQTVYSEAFTAQQAAKKFSRIRELQKNASSRQR